MELEKIIPLIFIPLGFLCLFRPILFLYLFIAIPVLSFAPSTFGDLDNIKLIQIGSINIYIIDYLLVVMGFFFLKIFFKKNFLFKQVIKNPISKIIIVLFLWKIIIGILSYLKGFELQNILRNIAIESLIFIAILVPFIKNISIKKERVFQFSIIAGLIVVAFGFLKYSVFHEIGMTSSGTQRTLSANANILLFFPLCYVLFHSDFWHRHKLLSLFFVILVAMGIQFSGFRSGWITFFFISAMWFIYLENKLELIWVPTLAVSLFSILIIMSLFTQIRTGSFLGDFLIRMHDTFNLDNKSTQERLSKWKHSIYIFGENPFLGLSRFPVYTMHLDESNQTLSRDFPEFNRSTHNLIATTAVHEGILGLTILIFFFIVVFNQFGRAPPGNRNYLNFLKVFMIAIVIFSMFETGYSNPTGKVFFSISLGLLSACVYGRTHCEK